MGSAERKNSASGASWLAAGILFLLLLGAVYYFLVDRPVRIGIREADEKRAALETQLDVLAQQTENVSGVVDEVDSLRAGGALSYMPSYNSEAEEVDLIHKLVDDNDAVYDFVLEFKEITRSENQIRRTFTLSFTTENLEAAKSVLRSLTHASYRGMAHVRYRCLVSGVTLEWTDDDYNAVSVSLDATFYETMAGGEPDLGLSEGERGQAVDPAYAGIPGGIAQGLDKAVGFVSGEPTLPGIDDVVNGTDG